MREFAAVQAKEPKPFHRHVRAKDYPELTTTAVLVFKASIEGMGMSKYSICLKKVR